MVVEVTGTISPYSGMQELVNGTVKVVDDNHHDYAPIDITELFASGDSLTTYVGLPVVIKGVAIGSQNLAQTSQYLHFELNGRVSYVRTFVTDFPIT